jgi:hypothetical protein
MANFQEEILSLEDASWEGCHSEPAKNLDFTAETPREIPRFAQG